MNRLKKTVLYSVILTVFAVSAFFVNELRTLREYEEHPEYLRGKDPAVPRQAAQAGDFVEPADGRTGPMSAPELAWLLREGIELNVLEDIAEEGRVLELYNGKVRKYNSLASVIEYKESDMRDALQTVERRKADIVREAEAKYMEMSMPGEVKSDPGASLVWYAQKYLRMLGYYPGSADGRLNEGIVSSVKMFQIMKDVPAAGQIDEELVAVLREFWTARKIPRNVGFGAD
ncbi:MAG: peptidoglycan-binding protein [Synergistaceae bacterium]|jgi:hypothetical protein|nr:peptidoglycan-binding protein [Synergistaceae bacterium]